MKEIWIDQTRSREKCRVHAGKQHVLFVGHRTLFLFSLVYLFCGSLRVLKKQYLFLAN
jgi:hypothetical protein